MTRSQEIPDVGGTIAVDGLESLVDLFQSKIGFHNLLDIEVSSLKERLREAAQGAINSAKGQAIRVFLRGTAGGVAVTAPDLSKKGNRPVLTDSKQKDLVKAGGVDALGLPPEELYDEERTPGGEVVELRGRWARWFVEQVEADLSEDPDIVWEKRESTVTRRVKLEAIPKLQVAAAAGNKVAEMLLGFAAKAMMVKVEK